ncbi:MAG: penicillin-binding protein 2 [Desulfobacterales bacterium]|nr:penicillin-binding protein 2 [Desulfobacterales bacterium]
MSAQNHTQKYLQRVDPEWYRSRLFGLMCWMVIAFIFLGGRLSYMQIIKGEYYHRISKNNCIRRERIKPFRGLIYDRNGHLLVENRPSFNLQMIEKDAEPLDQTVKKISAFLELEPEDIMTKLEKGGSGGYEPVLIQEDIDRNTMAAVSAHRFELPGISIETRARRHYRHPSLASHLLGYLGELSPGEIRAAKFWGGLKGRAYVGRFGVEKAFEDYLAGEPGGRIVQVNAGGQVVDVLDRVPPEPGHNIYLTIDYKLQQMAETLLGESVGAVIAMAPDSGEILAMASSPGFNQNHFVDGMSPKEWQSLSGNPEQPMMNKALQGEYPPASTYKIVTAMAALEEALVNINEEVYCPGHYQYGNRLYHCWKEVGHGRLNVVQALSQSCDVFFYHMGKRLNVDTLAKYAHGCGLGSPTGIHLNGEADGLIPTSEWKLERYGSPWQGGETLSIAIGQGYNLVTPLQMAVLIAAIANGGTRYQPTILKTIETVEGKQVKKGRPAISGRLPAGKKTLETIRKGLWRVVNARHGTAYWHVRDKSIEISGKTGTAQIVSRKKGEERSEEVEDQYKPHAWFIGYAPSDNPEIAVSVLVEHGEHGSSGAGPIAGKLMRSYLEKNTKES